MGVAEGKGVSEAAGVKVGKGSGDGGGVNVGGSGADEGAAGESVAQSAVGVGCAARLQPARKIANAPIHNLRITLSPLHFVTLSKKESLLSPRRRGWERP